MEKGVPVIQADLDEGLSDYPDKSFDYVVLSKTIQVVRRPDRILKELLRVGETGIVSLLNFGYWKVRSQLFFKGRMPRTSNLPYQWYDTPNIHLSTIKDIHDFCRKENITIQKQVNVTRDSGHRLLTALSPNLFTELSIFVISRANRKKSA